MVTRVVFIIVCCCRKMLATMIDDLGVAVDIPIIMPSPSINHTTPITNTTEPSKYVNTTMHNATANKITPVITQPSVAWQLQTPSEGQTALLQEETSMLFQWSYLGYDTTYALIKFPFNQSLAIASFPPLLTTSISGSTTINAHPTVEHLPKTSGDWLINDISLNPHIDTLFLTNQYGIFTLIDNYRGALSSLPVGTAKGLTQVLTMPPPSPSPGSVIYIYITPFTLSPTNDAPPFAWSV